jgi:site-specific recombinase XerD
MSQQSESSRATAHLTSNSNLVPAIIAWRYYLSDQGDSPHTVKAFISDLNLMASYLPPDKTLGGITTSDLNNFLDWMQKSRGVPCSPKTLSRRITSIKAFFRWLHQFGVLLIDPAERVLQHTVISPLPVVLTSQETQTALNTAEEFWLKSPYDSRYIALFDLLINTGIKKSETLSLRLNHVDLEAPDGPILFIRYVNPQYRYKERKIPLPESGLVIYPKYRQQYHLEDQLFPWSPRRLEYLLEDIGQQAGIEKHISFEMCRWTCCLRDWQSGMEPDKIRQKLGISKIQWREVSLKLRQLSGEI